MSDAIKAGDLVAVVRPEICCGDPSEIGKVGIAALPPAQFDCTVCDRCGDVNLDVRNWFDVNGRALHRSQLKRINPPAIGDSLPTRADLDIPEPACP